MALSPSTWPRVVSRHLPQSARRVAVTYAALFSCAGASLPFLPVWLEARGFDGPSIGLILGSAMVLQFALGLVAGVIVDRLQAPRRIMQTLALISTSAFLILWPPLGAVAAVCLVIIAQSTKAPLGPLLEAGAMSAARRVGFSYSLVRAVGSGAFVVANVVVGALIVPGRVGPDLVLWWSAGGLALFALCVRGIPRPPVDAVLERLEFSTVRADLLRPTLVFAFLANACVQASHAFYYSFSAIVWIDAGVSGAVVGGLWAWAVIAEIALLVFLGARLERWGAGWLLVMGAGIAVIRWTLMGFDPDQAFWSGVEALASAAPAPGVGVWGLSGPQAPNLMWLLVLQTLHAGTFACAHLGAMVFIADHLPARVHSTAQTLNAGMSMGFGLAVGTTWSGVLVAWVGGVGYWGMTLIALLGLMSAGALMRALQASSARKGA